MAAYILPFSLALAAVLFIARLIIGSPATKSYEYVKVGFGRPNVCHDPLSQLAYAPVLTVRIAPDGSMDVKDRGVWKPLSAAEIEEINRQREADEEHITLEHPLKCA